MPDAYLAHYGIKGMKWGIRRYQNSDGSLTPEGKARARKEYKQDNKEAFEKGKNATVMSKAASYSQNVLDKSIKRYQKNMTEKNSKRVEDAIKVNNFLQKEAKKSVQEAEAHHKSLIKKYGKDAVSDIKYDKKGRVSERTVSNSDIATSLALTLGVTGAAVALRLPVAYISRPTSAVEKGLSVYSRTATQVARERRERERGGK